MNLNILTVETKIEHILKSNYNIKTNNLLYKRDCFCFSEDGFYKFHCFKIRK